MVALSYGEIGSILGETPRQLIEELKDTYSHGLYLGEPTVHDLQPEYQTKSYPQSVLLSTRPSSVTATMIIDTRD